MDGRFLVLHVRLTKIGSKESECWRKVWMCTHGKPVEASNKALVCFGVSLEVMVIIFRQLDVVNGKDRALRSHVGHAVHFIDSKQVFGIFSKGRLAQVNREVAIRVMLPCT